MIITAGEAVADGDLTARQKPPQIGKGRQTGVFVPILEDASLSCVA